MGKYLLNNKVYDTDEAEEVIKYIKPIEHNGLFSKTYPKYRHTLYKTQKGQFFVHVGEYVGNTDVLYNNKDYIELLDIDKVKDILNRLNAIEQYKKNFDDLEEG